MSDMLSQKEIDALLNGEGNFQEPNIEPAPPEEEYFSIIEKDALGEIGNISFGSSATALSSLLNQKVEITTPDVAVIHRNELIDEFPKPYIAVEVGYTKGIIGSNLLIIHINDAAIIADLMLGGTGESVIADLSEIHISAVQEAMNQMMGNSATSMSTIFNRTVDISPPVVSQMDLKVGEGIDIIPREDTLVKVSFRLKVGELIDSNIMQLIPILFAKELVNNLLHPINEEVIEMMPAENDSLRSTVETVSTEKVQQPVVTGYEEYEEDERRTPVTKQSHQSVQPAVFTSFDHHPTEVSVEARNLHMLYDIPLQVTVELGRTKRSVKEILELAQGSILELDKVAGEPVDILVNQKLVARGEVVVIDENFGVRVTDIVSKKERLNQLS